MSVTTTTIAARMAVSGAVIALTEAAERSFVDVDEKKRLTSDVREALDAYRDALKPQ